MFSFFIKQNPIIILNSKLFHTSTVRYLNCRHPFHILKSSYLPLMLSISIYLLALGAILFFHLKGPFYIKNFIYIGLILVVLTMFFWFKRIFFEADSRYHSSLTKQGFRIGFILFILSEIMFFAAFF
jgi:cytochrome c oxidase subunit 3